MLLSSMGEILNKMNEVYMKKLRIATLTILLLVTLMTSCGNEDKENVATQEQPTLTQRISSCSKLYTTQYNVHKILTYEDANALKGSVFNEEFSIPIPGDRKILIPIDAVVKAYIDFSKFSDEDVKIDGERITIVLPQPNIEMTSSKIDYENEKAFVSWNRSDFTSEEKESFIQQGRASILQSMAGSDIIDKSRVSAYNVLLPILESAGYKPSNITLKFPDKIEENKKSEQTIHGLISLPKKN